MDTDSICLAILTLDLDDLILVFQAVKTRTKQIRQEEEANEPEPAIADSP